MALKIRGYFKSSYDIIMSTNVIENAGSFYLYLANKFKFQWFSTTVLDDEANCTL